MRVYLAQKRKLPLATSKAERSVQDRHLMAECIQDLRALGVNMKMAAWHLSISLSKCNRIHQGRIGWVGRPRQEPDSETRSAIEKELAQVKGKVSIRNLRKAHSGPSRRAIGDLKKDWVRRYKAAQRARQKRLTWTKPGCVWALDGGKTKAWIEGEKGCFLAMRDMASGYTLEASQGHETIVDVLQFLRRLFGKFGVPLVLKHDGGPGFTANEVQEFLVEMGVVALLSPAYYPQYNGAVERGMQDIKALSEACASWKGRADHWLQEDLDRAVGIMNAREVKRSGMWSTPQQRFETHTPVTPSERARFQAASRAASTALSWSMRRRAAREGGEVDLKKISTLAARLGTTRALVNGGYLVIEEGRLSQPIEASTCVIISAG